VPVIVKPMIGDWEVPSIESIQAHERRRFASLDVPGLLGDLTQDLGTVALHVTIAGSLTGDQARDDFLTSLRGTFRAGDPVAFVADIATAAELHQVVVESLDVVEVAELSDTFHYCVVLREYVEPPAPPPPLDDFGADLSGELGDLAALGLDGLQLPDLLGDIPAIGNPVEPLQPALAQVQKATQALPEALGPLHDVFLGAAP
jgi:hypothetical protein